MTVTGKTLAENVQDAPDLEFEQQKVVRSIDNPLKATGHIRILKGNLAPGTAVAKITGKEGVKFEASKATSVAARAYIAQARAMCFDTQVMV